MSIRYIHFISVHKLYTYSSKHKCYWHNASHEAAYFVPDWGICKYVYCIIWYIIAERRTERYFIDRETLCTKEYK